MQPVRLYLQIGKLADGNELSWIVLPLLLPFNSPPQFDLFVHTYPFICLRCCILMINLLSVLIFMPTVHNNVRLKMDF